MNLAHTSAVSARVAHAPAIDIGEDADVIEIEGMTFTQDQVEAPTFLIDRASDIAAALAKDLYWTRYEPENRVRSFEETAAPAQAKIDAYMAGSDHRRAGLLALSKMGGGSDWYLHDEIVGPAVTNFLGEMQGEAESCGWRFEYDDDDEEELKTELRAILQDEDDSEPTDLLGSCDMVQLAFVLMPKDGYFDDNLTWSHKSWSEWSELSLTEAFQKTLPRLGYTVEQYREHSKNDHELHDEPFGEPETPRLPVATLDELQTLVDNACSQYFHFAIYANVRLDHFLELDLGRPIRLDSYAIATIGIANGTFMDERKKVPIVLRPDDGRWVAFEKGPHEWCGLVGSYYNAEISQ